MASALPQKNIGISEISDKKREFDELVTMRGLEFRQKVNEKREMDLQLIKFRPLDPLPPGAFERLQNNQIWETVLEYLTRSYDIESARRTCPTFEDILMGKIPNATPDERQVSAVVRIMNEGKFVEPKNLDRWKLLNRGLWKLRLVSKSWHRATTQAFLKDSERKRNLELRGGTWWQDNANITRHENLDRFGNLLRKSKCKSLILQTVSLDERCTNEIGIIFPRLLLFFDTFGKSVQELVVEWNEEEINISWPNKYLNLLNLVARMPNLKALTIEVKIRCHDPPDEVVEDLNDLILRRPFPSCSSLEVLSVKGYFINEPLVAVVTEILSKCCELKSLSLPEYMLEKACVAGAVQERLIKLIDCNFFNHLRKKMLPLPNIPPLRKIVLSNYGYENCSELSRALNLFGNTLEHLELPNFNFMFIGGPGLVALQLPKLRKLILPCWPGITNLDFFIPLSGLDHLEFLYNAYFEIFKNPHDKFHLIEVDNFDKLEESNIWMCFPNLHFVKVIVHNDLFQSKSSYKYQYVKRGEVIKKEKL